MKLGCVFDVTHSYHFVLWEIAFVCSICCKIGKLTTSLFFKDQIISLNAIETTFLLYLVMQGGDISIISYEYDTNSMLIS